MAKGKYHEWLEEDGLLKIKGWARDGLTEEQIAENMGISVRTLFDWKTKHIPIMQALKDSKEIADRNVENALYRNACGYWITLEKPQKVKKTKIGPKGFKVAEWEEIVMVAERVWMKPDTTAQIFWLKNRKPEEWRDKREVAASVDSENTGVLILPAIDERLRNG